MTDYSKFIKRIQKYTLPEHIQLKKQARKALLERVWRRRIALGKKMVQEAINNGHGFEAA